MRALLSLSIAAALLAGGCAAGVGTSTSTTITSPSASSSMAGVWVGTTADSSGSMMGAGLTASMMSNMTWNVTQSGPTFTGTAQFAGYRGGMATISGTMTGHSGTFTITMPTGSMMMNGTCTATATGTFDMDDMMTTFHATYAGTNTCTGPFNAGQISMTHR